MMASLLLFLSLGVATPPAPPLQMPRRIAIIARARIISGTAISLSNGQPRSDAAVVRKGLIEFR